MCHPERHNMADRRIRRTGCTLRARLTTQLWLMSDDFTAAG